MGKTIFGLVEHLDMGDVPAMFDSRRVS